MHRISLSVALAIVIVLSLAPFASADESIRVGTMTVQHHGDHGKSVILVPGLASGGWVWDDLVGKLKNDHQVFVVTLAGFDGTKAPSGKMLMDLADDSLVELIRTQHIDKPVLIGHSLGGTLSIRFAQEHSDFISGVIAMDGLPIFPGTEDVPAAQKAGRIEMTRALLAGMTPEQFKAQQLVFMKKQGVLSEAKATELAEKTSRSDIAATAQYMAEDLLLDLRPNLAAIKVPLLEICPYNAGDYLKTKPITEKEKAAYYRTLLKGTPNFEVVSISPSRHFVMFDQPDAVATAVNQFLGVTKPTTSTSSSTSSRPARPPAPTRDPHSPGFVDAKELPDGAVPPADVDGNFIIGPTHKPAAEMVVHDDIPQGKIFNLAMKSADSRF
ncbi:MAG TPA: alpha/beta hydrolase, partial [Tepidisphaeraceae bacterium]|nr:alpha/beta hydrolase [Tepidisphaeraceae bacterium]